jgi:Fe-S cluster assembly protein SufD
MSNMIEVQEEKNVHTANFAEFEREAAALGSAEVQRTRRAALRRFSELGFPNQRNEDWRFTNVAPLAKIPFKLAARDKSELNLKELEEVACPLGSSVRLVFINGHFAPELSSARKLPAGVVVDSLAEALQRQSEFVESHLGKYAKYQNQPFTALNTAFIRDGALVSIPRGKVLEDPIYLLFVTTTRGEGSVAHPRNLIVVGENSQVRLVEAYVGLEEELYFTNAVTELVAGENTIIDHYKLQRESQEAFHIGTLQVQQNRCSNFSTHYIGLGGALVRNEIRVVLDGEGCEATINGLYMAGGRQHMDNQTVLDHAKPHCASHELYKGILDGRAHGVFNGKIFVHQDAQKTDAKQTNQTLLLSDDAIINTKPQLEIYADDVKCTHGATVGQLDAEAIFYLRTRGISAEEARNLLTYAFANDIIGRIQIESLRARLEELLVETQHLPPSQDGRETL